MRCSVLLNCLILASLLCAVGFAGSARAANSPTIINVKDYGAVGDGKADDTAAFLQAIDAAKAAGLPVHVPRGAYCITKTLVVDNIEVIGSTSGAWPADSDALPSIKDEVVDGPCFEMRKGGSLHGLSIEYSRPRDASFKYAAVLVTGIGVYISNMRIIGAYDGIASDGVSNIGRINVQNVFMASVQHEGVRLTGTYDVPRLASIEVWNGGNEKAPFTTGVGFHLGRNDGLRMTDCFAFAMSIGYLFDKVGQNKETQGKTAGSMNGCSSDFCITAVEVDGPAWLSMSGCFFWCHESCLVINAAEAKIQIAGSLMRSNGAPCIQVLAADSVDITGCDLTRPMKEHPAPGILVAGGTVTIGSNTIDTFGDGVQVDAGATGAIITGNAITARGGQAVKAAPGANVAIGTNLLVAKPTIEN